MRGLMIIMAVALTAIGCGDKPVEDEGGPVEVAGVEGGLRLVSVTPIVREEESIRAWAFSDKPEAWEWNFAGNVAAASEGGAIYETAKSGAWPNAL